MRELAGVRRPYVECGSDMGIGAWQAAKMTVFGGESRVGTTACKA